MKMKNMLIGGMVALALGVITSHAALIVSYHTDGTSNATVQSAVPHVQGPGVAAGNAVFGPFVGNSEWRENPYSALPAGTTTISGSLVGWHLYRSMGASDPVSTTSYEGFSFSYAGATLGFTTFTFDMISRGGNDAQTAKYAVFASKNSAPFVTVGSGSFAVPAGQVFQLYGLPVAVDISSLGTLSNGDNFEFRLAIGGSTSNEHGIFTQGIQVSAIPEPATLSMIGIAGIAMLLRRRIVRG